MEFVNSLKKRDVEAAFQSIRENIERHKDELTALDSALGDGDLGITMCKGFRVICDSFGDSEAETDIGNFIKQMGFAMSDAVPSTMGTLLSMGIVKAGNAVTGKTEIGADDLPKMLGDAADAIARCGKTKRGDKTILDALYPALEELRKAVSQNCSLEDAARRAWDGARAGAESTKKMKSTIGKAAIYGDQSIGKQDPGATVAALIFEGIWNSVSSGSGSSQSF